MTIKLISTVLIILFLAVSGFTQKRFELELSLEKPELLLGVDINIVKVKITNLTEKDISTGEAAMIKFYLSRCPKDKDTDCRAKGDIYFAGVLPSSRWRDIKPKESTEAEINLSKLSWDDVISPNFELTTPNNFYTVPARRSYFFAESETAELKSQAAGQAEKKYRSNQIEVITR
jgi:hypothetical protein